MASEASLSEGERLVLKLHPHGKTLLRPCLAGVIAASWRLRAGGASGSGGGRSG
ncbi:MAG: hypothetical protein ABSB01_02175 [Streptosporangiaceae bacterium]|jgi:hypothetical protein